MKYSDIQRIAHRDCMIPAQRCHDPEMVTQIIEKKGIEIGDGLKTYIESFRHGVSPHGEHHKSSY